MHRADLNSVKKQSSDNQILYQCDLYSLIEDIGKRGYYNLYRVMENTDRLDGVI